MAEIVEEELAERIWTADSPEDPDGAIQRLKFCSKCRSIMSSPENLRLLRTGTGVPICNEPGVCSSHCSLRNIALECIKMWNKSANHDDPRRRPVEQDLSKGFLVLEAHRTPSSKLGRHDFGSIRLSYVWRDGSRGGQTPLMSFDVFALQRDPASQYISAREAMRDVASQEAFDQVHNWMIDCEKSHRGCPKPGLVRLPNRVIDVAPPSGPDLDPDFVRVHETSGGTGKYVALSYCWGGPQAVSLTRATRSQMERKIDLNLLPQTLQDAVLVTRKLGMRYLWVDAICIIQDCEEDMERELKAMGEIYRNAAVTISAASTRSVHDGFLQKRKPKPSKYPRFTLPYRAWEGDLSPGNVVIQEEVLHNAHTEPINSRAWTLQERLLSPRLLIYGTHELLWQCQEGRAHASMRKTLGPGSRRLDEAFFRSGLSLSTDSLRQSWVDTVTDYTNRKVSFVEDKLVALAGLATAFQTLSQGDVYLAGLWRSWLPRGLMWSFDSLSRPFQPRPAAYTAPSWSWASVSGPVTFDRSIDATDSMRPYLAEILSCETVLEASTILTGRVVSGILRVRGRMRETRWTETTLWDGPGAVAEALEKAWMDADEDKPEVISCLRMTPIRGLILTATDSNFPLRFRRVGVFEVLKGRRPVLSDVAACDSWFESGVFQIVEII